MSGGAASEEAYPTEATTETRRAARSGSSEAALIPTGKASAAPSPHRAMPIVADHSQGLKPNSKSPASPNAADMCNTDTRVCRSRRRLPNRRIAVIAHKKMPSDTAPIGSADCSSHPEVWSDLTVTDIQTIATSFVRVAMSTDTLACLQC